jgi:hypothetical protein
VMLCDIEHDDEQIQAGDVACQKIAAAGGRDWGTLFQPSPFFSTHKSYLQGRGMAEGAEELRERKGWVESRLRQLVAKVETEALLRAGSGLARPVASPPCFRAVLGLYFRTSARFSLARIQFVLVRSKVFKPEAQRTRAGSAQPGPTCRTSGEDAVTEGGDKQLDVVVHM